MCEHLSRSGSAQALMVPNKAMSCWRPCAFAPGSYPASERLAFHEKLQRLLLWTSGSTAALYQGK